MYCVIVHQDRVGYVQFPALDQDLTNRRNLAAVEHNIRRAFRVARRTPLATDAHPADVSRFRCADGRGRYTVIVRDLGTEE